MMDEYLSQKALDSLLIFSLNPKLSTVVILKWTSEASTSAIYYIVSFPKYVRLP
jgi:hypothetical protein